jgi:hypothetical protein
MSSIYPIPYYVNVPKKKKKKIEQSTKYPLLRFLSFFFSLVVFFILLSFLRLAGYVAVATARARARARADAHVAADDVHQAPDAKGDESQQDEEDNDDDGDDVVSLHGDGGCKGSCVALSVL